MTTIEFTACNCFPLELAMEPERRTDRLYTRYPFSAAAEIVHGSGAQMPSRVTNISFGGCRLMANGRFPINADVQVKIQSFGDYFESPAQVVHSTATDLGVMFRNIGPGSFNVLHKWISGVRPPTPDPLETGRKSGPRAAQR
jgi:hypothetical protein